MSDIKNREMKITGYIHPTENTSNNSINTYKIFNTEEKNTDYTTSRKKGGGYATFTDKNSIPKGCPECGGEALYVCDCELKDKQCYNGHIWYIDKYCHIKKGDPHEDE